jgi:succinylglutamate desuccinylase
MPATNQSVAVTERLVLTAPPKAIRATQRFIEANIPELAVKLTREMKSIT